TPEAIRKTRKRALELTGGTPATIHWDLISLALSCKSVLAVAPMQDYLGLGSTARLNTPGTTGNNWRWRMRADQLRPDLVGKIADLVRRTSREPRRSLDSAP
ncbi:MAG: 4-alpha-glucanotransferase, partial [Lysobacterales bacterium]